MVSDETFFAWLDGELDPQEAARVEAEVAADPRLSAMATEHRAMQDRLRSAFGTIVDAPLPEALLTTIRNPPQAEVIDFDQARKRRESRHWASTAQWGAMAATLAVGIFVGTLFPRQQQSGPVELQDGKLYAASALDQALGAQLASAPAGAVRIGMTFRDQDGAICRSFTARASSGLACRENNRWQVRGLFAAPEGQGGDYRMAAGMDPNLAALVDSTIRGEPFDAAQEKASKAHGWK